MNQRERQVRNLLFCGAALAALEWMAAYRFLEGSWSWDWSVRSSAAGVVLLACGALVLGAAHRLLRKLTSLTGDRDLRTYWCYCAGLMLLCMLWQDLDSSFYIVLLLVAILSTPLGLVGAALGALPGGIHYMLCHGVMFALSAAEAGYLHWLLHRHRALRAGYTDRKG